MTNPAPPTDRELYPAHDEPVIHVRTKAGEDGVLVAEEARRIILRCLDECGEHGAARADRGGEVMPRANRDHAVIIAARCEVVRDMLAEYAAQQQTDRTLLPFAQLQATNAIRAGRSAWYAYERIGKQWLRDLEGEE